MSDKSNMTINVEFLAGTKIEDAVKEAKEKAQQLDVAFICFNFNGVHLSIGRNADVSDVVNQWKYGEGPLSICEA